MNETIMFKEIHSQPELLENCYQYNQPKIEELASVIERYHPTNIMLIARGTSYHGAVYAQYLLELYCHLPVAIALPSVFTVYQGTMNLEKTLVIAISQSGKGRDIVEATKKAREFGALTIAITNELESALAKTAEHILCNNVGKAEADAATKTYTSTIYLATKLVYALSHEEKIHIEEPILFDTIRQALTYQDKVKEAVQKFRTVDDTFVLGRGTNLSLAMELALKMKETSNFHVSSYPISEFYHGPIAMITEKTPVIVFGIDRVTNPNAQKMIEDLKEFQAYILGISNDPKVIENASVQIYIDCENDLYALFMGIIILQLFAGELAVARNMNPDKVEKLVKIDTF